MSVRPNRLMRSLRMSKQLTQESMANLVGLSPQGYAKIERGEVKPSAENLHKIAQVLGVDASDLMQMDNLSDGYINVNRDNSSGIQAMSINHYYGSNVVKIKLLEQEVKHLKEMLVQKDNEILALRELNDVLKKSS